MDDATDGAEPDYRFTLANERTFLAWVRTALALLAGGVAVAEYLPGLEPAWLRETVGVGLAVLGTVMAALSHHRWRRVQRAMRHGRPLPSSPQLPILAAGVTALAVVVLALLILAAG